MSAEPEFIELRELTHARSAGPGRTRLERANALRIAPGTARYPARHLAPGRGHRFQPAGPATHTWCDLCGDFIWGVVRKGLQCAHCKFTCHYRCRALVCLDCCGPRDMGWEPALERDTNVVSAAGAGGVRAGPRRADQGLNLNCRPGATRSERNNNGFRGGKVSLALREGSKGVYGANSAGTPGTPRQPRRAQSRPGTAQALLLCLSSLASGPAATRVHMRIRSHTSPHCRGSVRRSS